MTIRLPAEIPNFKNKMQFISKSINQNTIYHALYVFERDSDCPGICKLFSGFTVFGFQTLDSFTDSQASNGTTVCPHNGACQTRWWICRAHQRRIIEHHKAAESKHLNFSSWMMPQHGQQCAHLVVLTWLCSLDGFLSCSFGCSLGCSLRRCQLNRGLRAVSLRKFMEFLKKKMPGI